MPREIHYILFSQEELHHALVEFQRSRGEKLPRGGIPTLKVEAGPEGPRATIKIEGDFEGAAKLSFEFGPAELLAAITLFCKSGRIPLAVRSEKRIELAGDCLALVATLSTLRGAPAKRGSTISYTDEDLEARRKKLDTRKAT